MATETVTSHYQRVPLPGSPTLTNPDMILPDYPDYDRADSPETPHEHMWKGLGGDNGSGNGSGNGSESGSGSGGSVNRSVKRNVDVNLAPDMLFQLPSPAHYSQDFVVMEGGYTGYSNGSSVPITPIIYGNGTMLSDIGEVTEVESTVGGRRRRASVRSEFDDDASVGAAAIAIGVDSATRRFKSQRRASTDSNSTVTMEDRPTMLATFDDTASVSDVSFQGDDEESVAESYSEDPVERATRRVARLNARTSRERYSTAILSKRAEEILANAKKRLTAMEGNLTRARSSLYVTSPLSITTDSSVTPPISRPATSFRDPLPSRHHRGPSEDPLTFDDVSPDFPQRSASALGAAGGYRPPLSNSRSVDALAGRYNRTVSKMASPADIGLEPLTEDTDMIASDALLRQSASLASAVDHDHDTYDEHLLPLPPVDDDYCDDEDDDAPPDMTRSASALQVRSIHYQMQDLKGKISSLKEQARADSLKRRSFRSLRAPSPFTHARSEHGYAGDGSAPSSTDGAPSRLEAGSGRDDGQSTPTTATYDETTLAALGGGGGDGDEAEAEAHVANSQPDPFEGFDDMHEAAIELEMEGLQAGDDDESDSGDDDVNGVDDDEDFHTDDGEDHKYNDMVVGVKVADVGEADGPAEVDDDGADVTVTDPDMDYASESGESLYHDTLQTSLSHEDREDAFDYEHFFLHSALGTISQQRLARRERQGSVSSDGSVETTRAVNAAETLGRTLSRRNSGDTISTVQSFATANEGKFGHGTVRNEIEEVDEEEEEYRENEVGTQQGVEKREAGDKADEEEDKMAQMGWASDEHDMKDNSAVTDSLGGHSDGRSHVSQQASVSSLSSSSSATRRSFPLVNKARSSGAPSRASGRIPTPPRSSPDQQDDTGKEEEEEEEEEEFSGVAGLKGATSDMQQMLAREDQVLVQRLVESLGRCVLGLSESGKATAERRTYRRRIDAARRLLEGLDS